MLLLTLAGHQWNESGCGNAVSGNARSSRRTQPQLETASGPNDSGMTSAFVHYNQLAGGLLSKGLSGQIFTQISDIECELSGRSSLFRVSVCAARTLNAVGTSRVKLYRCDKGTFKEQPVGHARRKEA